MEGILVGEEKIRVDVDVHRCSRPRVQRLRKKLIFYPRVKMRLIGWPADTVQEIPNFVGLTNRMA